MRPDLRFFFCVSVSLAAAHPVQAQLDEEADLPPGLVARYSAGGETVKRVDPDVAFVWGTESPDPRLPAGSFQVEWSGRLLVREAARYQFHAFVQGDVSLKLDGRNMLKGRRDRPGWVSGEPASVELGVRTLAASYRRTGEGAVVKLYWSSDEFPLEPIPGHAIFHETGRGDLAEIERGRLAWRAHRCNRCHRRAHDPLSPPGPALTHLAAGTSLDRIVGTIVDPREPSPHARMPSFGFTREDACAVAAFLLSKSKPVKLPSVVRSQEANDDRLAGRTLFRSIGCLACHAVEGLGASGPTSGPELSRVGEKRTAGWLLTWLREPEKLNPDHRMPAFKLERREQRQLALYLASLKRVAGRGSRVAGRETASADSGKTKKGGAEVIARGRRLVEAARCANCHRIDGLEPEFAAIPDLSEGVRDWEKSCVGRSQESGVREQKSGVRGQKIDVRGSRVAAHKKSKSRRVEESKRVQPHYQSIDRKALAAYLTSYDGTLAAENRHESGLRVLRERNCLACHERDGWKGIVATAGRVAQLDERLRGQSEALIPPPLTAVGDKLRDSALAEAVSGEAASRRLPWLHVRMPRFRHSEKDKAALLAYLIGHDRIPEQPAEPRDDTPSPLAGEGQGGGAATDRPHPSNNTRTDSDLLAGRTLLGVKGFSCIACHKAGPYEPRNVALGTRGSDLLMPGRRMRRSFFLRWTRSPLRIVPGVEMPSYQRPAPDVLDEQIDTQLAALWEALNDPRFTPPINPAAVEQLVTVAPGEPARIVRDVFSLPAGPPPRPSPTKGGGSSDGYVARALAIGLNNGHNILYDLDTFSVRGWHFGDFARQRNEGKSWFWDMAGVPVMTGFPARSDFALLPLTEQRLTRRPEAGNIIPASVHGTNGRLLNYANDAEGVRINYEIDFEVNGRAKSVRIREHVAPESSDSARSGWIRRIVADGVPDGCDLCVARPSPQTRDAIGEASVRPVDGSSRTDHRDQRDYGGSTPLVRSRDKPGRASITLRYDARLARPPASTQPKEPPRPEIELENVTSVPGFDGVRLPVDRSIMPTAITWTKSGLLAFTSLKGHVYLAHDTDGDGIEDKLTVFEEGLAAPYGIIADGEDLIVAHKPELLRLRDADGDGRADERVVVASGWGYSDNYHDWTCGIVRDSAGNFYVGLGSDYADPKRVKERARWRGKVLRISPDGRTITPLGHSFRYPTGLAIDGDENVFVSDQQGVQNTFNEINHLVAGRHYGVPSKYENATNAEHHPPAIQVPHPWTRSVNGLFFLPRTGLAGHGIGCEYNNRFLVRFTTQKIPGTSADSGDRNDGGVIQGAVYAFSRPDAGTGPDNFLGPLCGAVAPNGDIYIGSIDDSGWRGGRNRGSIVRLRPNGRLPNGIRELRATTDGFEIEFFRPVGRAAAAKSENYAITGYTRLWQGSYATPDSGRHTPAIKHAGLSPDAKRVRLVVEGLRPGHVYEVSCGRIAADADQPLFPATGHYTLHRIPEARD